ncbi:MAG: hypothetical protein ACIAQF_02630 [Phycisphaerales bacterium JB065]
MPKFTVYQSFEARRMMVAEHEVEAATFEEAVRIAKLRDIPINTRAMGDEYYSLDDGWGADEEAAKDDFERKEAEAMAST